MRESQGCGKNENMGECSEDEDVGEGECADKAVSDGKGVSVGVGKGEGVSECVGKGEQQCYALGEVDGSRWGLW